eukprot:TRINITY_DN440_c0_g3_i1.p7 TRINITY_DN440_c0_g3~~TRINITY_DN440_c0_g3_i1.p7  ORF type:complete len:111 (+),score=0.91 TRINITY_DN440_c0_g3_i1:744-1076(+)
MFGVVTLAGFVSVFSKKNEGVVKIIHTILQDVIGLIAYLNVIRRVYKVFQDFGYGGCDEKKCVEGGLITREAIGKMKDCDTQNFHGGSKKIDKTSVIRMFSIEDGCRKNI